MSKEDLFAEYLNDKRIREGRPTKERKYHDYPDTINEISLKLNTNVYNFTLEELKDFIRANSSAIKNANNKGRWYHALKNYYTFLINNN